MGGVGKVVSGILGMDKGAVAAPRVPDLEAERKKAEAEALRKRAGLADKGMSGTVMGGSVGGDAAVSGKKLLGE